jgi:hypothetical protein
MILPKGISARRTRTGNLVMRVHYSADPERGPEWAKTERRKYSSQGAWDREQEIIHEAGGGERLFSEALDRWEDRILIDPYTSGFRPSPHWRLIGGFDHGKANPTAALVAAVDFDGVIYVLGEYYQPGLSPRQHVPALREMHGFMRAEVFADPSIFYKTQAQADGRFKAISELYNEEGIAHLQPAPENNELLGMERILAHWTDLEHREPTLKIVCPRGQRDLQRPVWGLHNDGCPNLVWELRRTRREELSATQLVNRNPTERIVDKDNHLRDALKYLVLSLPEPQEKPAVMKALEAMQGIPEDDITSRMIRYQQQMERAKDAEEPVAIGRRAQMMRSRARR